MPELRQFHLPDLGEGLLTAEIVRWHVAVGDRVTDGTPVCEVETVKATVELPIPFDGVIHEIRAAEGATVDVGTPIVVVAVESSAVLVGYGVTAPAASRWAARRAAAGASRGPSAAKPPVRRLAKTLGVDLHAVTPTGPGATITRTDVQSASARPATVPAQPAPAPPAGPPVAEQRPVPGQPVGPPPAGPPVTAPPVAEQRPVAGPQPVSVQRAMARAMVASAFTAPHASESITVDVTRTVKLVDRLRADPALAGRKVTALLLVARALLGAVARNPGINAVWDAGREQIVPRDHVNLGIAVAGSRGLLVPNVKDAHTLTLPDLAAALTDLTERARTGTTTPAEMTGGTVTITNIGALGVDDGTPILNPGEPAILAFGAIRRRPWEHKGRVRLRQVTTLTLAFDHRVVDGALGARVLTTIAAALERPERLIV
ncbi:2-oxo acid dehydrogenase subunit E2 [Dactylosporangium aurantiacum]|uniref:Dihydrolipoamide acetyltransferase component of pyruvate dehydrogenase complex n=1 Tax=Dactylosporangium aurantiacum TaxID=35754 RepID=A0A9Q9MCA8_9ACTN|nr:dihydrolipoamide acetyltransferase family protein [Dactylosporangium aurantiacum]MDG6106913.1 dihydrolipoamide acetyltransferase family protein [Dactylosporangium aurantiacum]UWZ50724.1 2-oxo acid dehydrogenase subunit E2 [Dactylosporangium aurantiacum]